MVKLRMKRVKCGKAQTGVLPHFSYSGSGMVRLGVQIPSRRSMAESQNVEYKASWRDEYLKWVCGFANAQGGCIYIGINDNGEAVGLTDCKRLLEDIPNKIKDTMGIIADVNCLDKNGEQYIQIIVNPSSYPISYRGEYHYRSGSTKQQLRGSALTEYLVRKTGYRWDAVPIDNISVADLDIESFEIFRREAVRTERMARKDLECTNEELLNKLGLIVDGKLKRAFFLVFQFFECTAFHFSVIIKVFMRHILIRVYASA